MYKTKAEITNDMGFAEVGISVKAESIERAAWRHRFWANQRTLFFEGEWNKQGKILHYMCFGDSNDLSLMKAESFPVNNWRYDSRSKLSSMCRS